MQLEQLEPRHLLSGLAIVGQGVGTASKPNASPQAVVPTVESSLTFTDSIDVVGSLTGSEHDDIFSLLNPTNGQTYDIDGAGGYDVFALKEFLSSDVTRNGTQLIVDATDIHFTINLTDVERVSLADQDWLTSDISLGRAGEFDVFVVEDMTADNTDVEGRIAIGGNGTFNHMGFGTRLTDNDAASRSTMVVGGDLRFTHGSVRGEAIVSGSMGVTEEAYVGGQFNVGKSPINFDAAQKHLIDVSNTIASLNATSATNVTPWGAITMNAAGAAGTQIFDLDGADLEQAVSWDIFADAGSTVIVNITGDDLLVTNFQMSLNGQPLNTGSTAPFNVLLNFNDATKLESTAFSWQGTVLAPTADVTFNNGHINGQMYVKSITGGAEYHLVPMQIDLPPVDPTTQTVFAIVDPDTPTEPTDDAPNLLGEIIACHDIFVIQDFVAADSGIEGNVAVGGDASFTNVGIGTGVGEWINENALTVGGDLTFEASLTHGPVAVGGTATGVAGAEVRTDSPIDFAQAGTDLINYSNSLDALAPTDSVHITPWNTIHLDGTNSPGETSVFDLSGSDLEQAVRLDIDGDAGGQIVINISGDNLSIGNFGMRLNGEFIPQGEDAPFNVLFNFTDATSVTTSDIAWQGSVLAPHANWQLANARVIGQLAVNSLSAAHGGFYMYGCDHLSDADGEVTVGPPTDPTDPPTEVDPTIPNNVPVASDDAFETCSHEVVTGELGTNDSDADEDDVLTYSLSQQAENGSVLVNLDGTFKYEANMNFVGTDTFEYLVDDGNGGTDTAVVTVDVVDCTPPEVDLAITKTMTNVTAGVRWSRSGNSDQIAYPFDVVEYSVTVTNVSDFKATSIVVEDVTPENVDIWKPGDSVTHSETGKRWDNNYWVGQLHTLNGFDGSPKFVDPTNGSVKVIEAGTASRGLTLSPGQDYDLDTGLVTWELGTALDGGESVTLTYYGMREVYTAYDWSYGTQFRTDASIVSLDQVDSDLTNNSTNERSWWVSPIALDLTGDAQIGVTGSSTVKGHAYAGGRLVDFDIDADGDKDRIEWFSGDGDGILVDKSALLADGRIDGSALFGDQGGRYLHGYEKLSLLDSNGDGILSDDELASLALWVDDGDADLEDGELKSLDEYDIAVLSLTMELDALGRMRSAASRADGSAVMTEDVWFARGE